MLDIFIFNTQIYTYRLKAPKNSVLHFGIQKPKALKINGYKRLCKHSLSFRLTLDLYLPSLNFEAAKA